MTAANANAASIQRIEDAVHYHDHREELEDKSSETGQAGTGAAFHRFRVQFTDLPIELVVHILKLLPGSGYLASSG